MQRLGVPAADQKRHTICNCFYMVVLCSMSSVITPPIVPDHGQRSRAYSSGSCPCEDPSPVMIAPCTAAPYSRSSGLVGLFGSLLLENSPRCPWIHEVVHASSFDACSKQRARVPMPSKRESISMVTCVRRECALHVRIGVQPPMLLVACKVLAAILRLESYMKESPRHRQPSLPSAYRCSVFSLERCHLQW